MRTSVLSSAAKMNEILLVLAVMVLVLVRGVIGVHRRGGVGPAVGPALAAALHHQVVHVVHRSRWIQEIYANISLQYFDI